ncbi:MAG TPA: sigma-70 family RNA polymerase sigma factor [Hanamia sp.]|jgi:RNA polymerase sigma-70 factor (ECF subfamily)|nr:sigma-70 family RNA polymerase sigma factor [Hanamia sp.]
MDLLSAKELNEHIRGCALNRRESQKKIYNSFYSYGMAICDRYTKRKEDAIEIFNDAFLKVFKEIHRFTPSYSDEMNSFKGWIRKILIYTAIDHCRKNNKHYFSAEMETAIVYIPQHEETGFDRISYDEIIRAIQHLSPAYRTVLNMFIIDGFSHEEIAQQLNISIGTSKSNLSKARQQLQKILKNENKILIAKNVG